MSKWVVDSNSWIIEGMSEPVDRDQLASLFFSNQLTGKQIRPAGVDFPLSHSQLQQIVGDIAPPPQFSYGQPQPAYNPVSPTEDPLRFVMPVNPSMWAMAAGYLGLFSVLCLPAPISLFAGIKGLKDIKENPNKNGEGRAWFGIIMGVIGTIMLLIVIAGGVIQYLRPPRN